MGDPRRTLLVVSERPQPWAYLRDHLESQALNVGWATQERLTTSLDALAGAPWVLAGELPTLPAEALERLRHRLFVVHWVGPSPPGLPIRPRQHAGWPAVALAVERALASAPGGLRLAATRGVLLPDGSYLPGGLGLEALLAAHPEGLELDGGSARTLAGLRRTRLSLERAGVPLQVASRGGSIRLEARSDVGAP